MYLTFTSSRFSMQMLNQGKTILFLTRNSPFLLDEFLVSSDPMPLLIRFFFFFFQPSVIFDISKFQEHLPLCFNGSILVEMTVLFDLHRSRNKKLLFSSCSYNRCCFMKSFQTPSNKVSFTQQYPSPIN